MEQHIEFGDVSAASAALAEAFDYFMRIAEDFALSEIRAAVAVASGPGWARPRRKPPPRRSARWIHRIFGHTVKAGAGSTDRLQQNGYHNTSGPGGSGPLILEGGMTDDRGDQGRRCFERAGARAGAKRNAAGCDRAVLPPTASRGGSHGRAGCGRGQHNPCVRFDSHTALHTDSGPPTEAFQIKYLLQILIASPEWVAPAT